MPASPPAAPPPVTARDDGAREDEPTDPYWPCTVCDGRNPISADACATCGTPFAQMMRSDEVPVDVAPKDALTRSLVFPGLGHRKVGRPVDGLVRGVLFAMAFGMAMLTGFGGNGSTPMLLVFLLFLTTALGVYVLSAYEAHRLALGGRPVVASRALTWVLVGVVLLSVLVLAVSVVTTARG
jgi:hypothetical protein